MSGGPAAFRSAAAAAAAIVVGLGAPAGSPAPEAASLRLPDGTGTAVYAEGAPLGFSGGFGEQSCHACHFDADVNAGQGRVTLSGVPDRFAAGTRYSIRVALSQPGMKLAGFQLTARVKGDGAQAGTLAPAPGEDPRVGIESDGRIQYAGQRQKGTVLPAPDAARWSLVWTAPSPAVPVVFHVAGNAADGDGTASGDYVYTATVESSPARRRSR